MIEKALRNSIRTRKGLGIVLLGIPFAIVGTIAMYFIFSDLQSAKEMEAWTIVNAKIESVELERNRSEDSVTFKTKVSYKYNVSGVEYTGTKVSLYSGADNIGSFQEDIYNQLESARKSNTPVDCYVNPNKNSESILYPKVRIEMLVFYLVFAVTFGLIGYGMIFWGWIGRKRQKVQSGLTIVDPAQPWMHRQDWKERAIKTKSRGTTIALTILALFWNALTLPAVLAIPSELKKGNYAILVILIFVVVGSVLAYFAILSIFRWRRFGRAVLKMQTLPVVPGQALKGDIHLGTSLPIGCKVELILKAVSAKLVHSGGRTSTKFDNLWSTNATSMPSITGSLYGGAVVPVSIPLPVDVPNTNNQDEDSRIFWTLSAKSDIPGADLDLEFEVPIFSEDVSH